MIIRSALPLALLLLVAAAGPALGQRDRPGVGGVIRPPTNPPSVPGSVIDRPIVPPTDILGTVTVESPVTGGREALMVVTLTKPAPETNPGVHCRGVFILTESSHPAIAPVPVSLCLQPGETTESFQIRPIGVATDTPVTLSAHYLQFPPRTATLDVLAPAVDRLEVTATTAQGGDTLPAVLHFTGPPPASPPVKAYLESRDPAVATVPASVILPANATSVPFKIVTHPVSALSEVRITASRNPPSPPTQGGGGGLRSRQANQVAAIQVAGVESVKLTVLPAKLDHVGTTNLFPVRGGVELDGAAPPEGALVQLTSSRPDLAKVPPSVAIASGQRSAAFDVVTSTPPNDATSVRITATYLGASKSVDFAVQRPDVVVRAMTIKDSYGNPVTTPQDTQPLTMCADVSVCGSSVNDPDCPSAPVPPTVALHYDYSNSAGVGREGDLQVPLDNAADGGFNTTNSVCMQVGGVPDHGWMEIKLLADPTNQIPERSEGNNGKSIKISRP